MASFASIQPRAEGARSRPADTRPGTLLNTDADGESAVTFASWNIRKLTTHTKDPEGWLQRKLHIISSLRALAPDFIAIQEVCSGEHGKAAVVEIAQALGGHWSHGHDSNLAICNVRGSKDTREQIAFLWRGDHPMLNGRAPTLTTLSFLATSSLTRPLPHSSCHSIALTHFMRAVTDGKLALESDLKAEEARILQGLAADGFTPHEISMWEFDRLPALLSFAGEDGGRPPLHVMSFHLSTGTTPDGARTKQQRAEVHVLQRLMMLAWQHGVHLIAMGDHNADMAQNAAIWDSDAVDQFSQCCQRFIPSSYCTNRFPYICRTGGQRNDDIFASSNLKQLWSKVGNVPAEILRQAEDSIIAREQPLPALPRAQTDACAAAFSKLLLQFDQSHDPSNPADIIWNIQNLLGVQDHSAALWRREIDKCWSDHRPIAARVEFPFVRPAMQSKQQLSPVLPPSLAPSSPPQRCLKHESALVATTSGDELPTAATTSHALARLQQAAQAISVDPVDYPDGLTVARMVGFAAGIHRPSSGGLAKTECRLVLECLGVEGAAVMKREECEKQMRAVLTRCGVCEFDDLAKQLAALTCAPEAKARPPMSEVVSATSTPVKASAGTGTVATPVKASAGTGTVATPSTSIKQPSRMQAPKDILNEAQSTPESSCSVEKFNGILKTMQDCDIQRVQHAAAGLSRKQGGLNISEFSPLLAAFGVDIRGIASDRSCANMKLKRLLHELGLQ